MISAKKFLLLLCLSLMSFQYNAQIKDFDKIEMLYDQGHYKIANRKASRLLDKPDYDFSLVPSYYKSLCLLQLSQNEKWFNRHTKALEEAKDLLWKVKKSKDGIKLMNAHINELIYLKSDLLSWLSVLKLEEKNDKYILLKSILNELFDQVPSIDKQGEINKNVENKSNFEPFASKERIEIINFAKKYIGTPYISAGNDPNGFDCSGFTSFVLNEFGVKLPRRAIDQEKSAKKIDPKIANKGDLVFFDNGSGISHVGIIVLNNGDVLEMIHASSSKGIIITDINKSEYWKSRIYSFGTYIDK